MKLFKLFESMSTSHTRGKIRKLSRTWFPRTRKSTKIPTICCKYLTDIMTWGSLELLSFITVSLIDDLLYLNSDDCEAKCGFNNACEFINTKMTEFFKGKELPLSKKVFDQLANWVERFRKRLES